MIFSKYICIDGDFLKESETGSHTGQMAFRFADAVHENIFASATEVRFLNLHLDRLSANLDLISLKKPAGMNVHAISQLITRLLNKNKIFGGAHIRISVFLNRQTGEPSFLMEAKALADKKYVLNEKGLIVDFYTQMVKQADALSGLRESAFIFYLLADQACQEQKLDDLILLNQYGKIVETIHSNLFLVSGDSVFTPALAQGCIPGIMRSLVIDMAGLAGLKVNDQSVLSPSSLGEAEEVFLTNATDGIRWVGAIRQNRYFNKISRLLTSKLNERTFPDK